MKKALAISKEGNDIISFEHSRTLKLIIQKGTIHMELITMDNERPMVTAMDSPIARPAAIMRLFLLHHRNGGERVYTLP